MSMVFKRRTFEQWYRYQCIVTIKYLSNFYQISIYYLMYMDVSSRSFCISLFVSFSPLSLNLCRRETMLKCFCTTKSYGEFFSSFIVILIILYIKTFFICVSVTPLRRYQQLSSLIQSTNVYKNRWCKRFYYDCKYC